MFGRVCGRWLRAAAFVIGLSFAGGCGGDAGDDAADTGEVTPQPAVTAPAPQTTSETPARAVDAETLPYAEINEDLVYGHFAFPSDMIEPLPAVIVVHDWWGLNDDVRAVADRLAAEGYMVLAIDLYEGDIFTEAADAREKMITVVENPDAVEANIRQALEFVGIAGAPGKASLGWGLGGGWSLNSAMMFPEELDAAVIYYGQVTSDEDQLRTVGAPVLGLFGARDRGITVDSVTEFSAAMHRLRKDHYVHVYDNVGHAFADPKRGTFNREIAEDAWQRTIDFLAQNLPADES